VRFPFPPPRYLWPADGCLLNPPPPPLFVSNLTVDRYLFPRPLFASCPVASITISVSFKPFPPSPRPLYGPVKRPFLLGPSNVSLDWRLYLHLISRTVDDYPRALLPFPNSKCLFVFPRGVPYQPPFVFFSFWCSGVL